jgi:hypothetical protein
MRYTLNEKELEITVDLLLNRYEISTNFLNDLYGRRQKSDTEAILLELQYSELDKKNLCKLLLINEGANLFAGSTENKRKLRKKILDKMPDTIVERLYKKHSDTSKNIRTASYMRKPLADKKWHSGKRWANDFIEAAGFPKILAGIAIDRTEIKRSVEYFEPKRRVPPLKEYQTEIKEKLLNILKKQEDKTRCMISLPTGERVIIVTGCINALRSRVSGTLVNMIHALLRVIKYNYCKQCMRSKDVLALQY